MDAEPPGSPTHVPAHALEHPQHVLPLELIAGLAQRQPRVLGEPHPGFGQRQVERNIVHLEHGLPRQHDRPVDDVLELAHVSRPVVANERLQGPGRDRADVAIALAGDLAHEVLDEDRNVVAPLAERGHVDGHHVQAIEEIVAERPLAHGHPEIDVGRREHAHVDGNRPHAADAFHLALLEHTEQPRLQIEAERADLVEEDGATVRQLELAELARVRAGEGAALVAEELRFDERVGDGRHVDGDERLIAPGTPPVDRPRHQLLAGAALARDEHGRGRLGQLRDELINAHHFGVAPDQPLEGVGALPSAGSERRSQTKDLALERPLLERTLDQEVQIVHVERLHQVVVGAQPHRRDGRPHVADLDARLSGHPLVEHDHVDLARPEHVQCDAAVLGFDHVARLFQDRAHGGSHAVLVVHDEDRAAPDRGGILGQRRLHGRRGRSSTTYSFLPAPPLPARWTHSGTTSPGLSAASSR